MFVLPCVPPNNPISACGATSFPGYHSFLKWAIKADSMQPPFIWSTLITETGLFQKVLVDIFSGSRTTETYKVTLSFVLLDVYQTDFHLNWNDLNTTVVIKVPLTPKNVFLWKKSTSFPDFISEKIISITIDKILAFLQAFEHVIPMFTTAQSGIWVGLLVTSLREPSWNTRETFDWA